MNPFFKDTKWIAGSGLPIKLWMNSVVPVTDANRVKRISKHFPNLSLTFVKDPSGRIVSNGIVKWQFVAPADPWTIPHGGWFYGKAEDFHNGTSANEVR